MRLHQPTLDALARVLSVAMGETEKEIDELKGHDPLVMRYTVGYRDGLEKALRIIGDLGSVK